MALWVNVWSNRQEKNGFLLFSVAVAVYLMVVILIAAANSSFLSASPIQK